MGSKPGVDYVQIDRRVLEDVVAKYRNGYVPSIGTITAIEEAVKLGLSLEDRVERLEDRMMEVLRKLDQKK